MADEQINTDIDDWLSDLDEEATEGELNQDDIDNLLGPDEALDTADNDGAIAAAGEETADVAPDTAQEESPSETTDEGPEELDQSEIDNLFGDGTLDEEIADGGSAVEEETSSETLASDLDQSEIDDLFSSSDDGAAHDDMDISSLLGDESPDLPDLGEDFDADSFTLEPTIAEATAQQQAAAPPPSDMGEELKTVRQDKEQQPFYRKPLFMAAAGFLLIILLGGGSYLFLFSGKEEPPAITETEQPATTETKTGTVLETSQGQESTVIAQKKVNTVPIAISNAYTMDKAGGAIKIILEGRDAEEDTLSFDLVSLPGHGRLSGKPPALTYLADKTFPGEDHFSFRSNDGEMFSEPTTIFIHGPNIAEEQKKVSEKKIAKKKPVIPPTRAKDIYLTTTSTTPLTIDWRTFWAMANKRPFDDTVTVDIASSSLKGQLHAVNNHSHRYTPPKFFAGDDQLSYRFKKAGKISSQRLIHITVAMGDHTPEIHFATPQTHYEAGQTVTLDARRTMDDHRQSLQFSWQQLTGVPVQLEARNSEGSMVAFVMPSAFSADELTGITMQLTATDPGGHQSSKDITIQGVSRRQTALWRGLRSNGIAEDPPCPGGDCPGYLLPWPYSY